MEFKTSSKRRLGWVDTAKGMAIILVALVHAVTLGTGAGLVHPLWEPANKLFQTLRMPLFFLAAGLFAGSAINRSWPALWRSRLALLIWTYIVWNLIRYLYFSLFASPLSSPDGKLLELVLAPFWPTSVWFLYALVIFLIMTKVMAGRVEPLVQILGAAAVSAFFFAFPMITNVGYSGIVTYYVFFVGGCYGRSGITSFASRVRGWMGAALGAAFLAASLTVAVSGLPRAVLFPLSLVAVSWGIVIAVLLARLRIFGWLSKLGQQTLGIYLAHGIVLAAVMQIALAVGASDWPGFRWASPVVFTVIAIICSLGLRSVARRTFMEYGYSPPGWFVRERSVVPELRG